MGRRTRSRWSAGHQAWAFERRAEFEGAVGTFLAEGAGRGERLMLVSDDPRPGHWPRALVGRRQLIVVSTDDVYGSDRLVDPIAQRATFLASLREAEDLGYTGLRVAADNTSVALGPERIEAWTRWEAEADALMRTEPITGLCAFDRSVLDATSLDALLALHAVTVS